jgi:hypothetical protein
MQVPTGTCIKKYLSNLKWFAYLTHLMKGNELRFLGGFMDGYWYTVLLSFYDLNHS